MAAMLTAALPGAAATAGSVVDASSERCVTPAGAAAPAPALAESEDQTLTVSYGATTGTCVPVWAIDVIYCIPIVQAC